MESGNNKLNTLNNMTMNNRTWHISDERHRSLQPAVSTVQYSNPEGKQHEIKVTGNISRTKLPTLTCFTYISLIIIKISCCCQELTFTPNINSILSELCTKQPTTGPSNNRLFTGCSREVYKDWSVWHSNTVVNLSGSIQKKSTENNWKSKTCCNGKWDH